MPIYVINVEFGEFIKVLRAKNKDDAVRKADIPVGAIFTSRRLRKEFVTDELKTLLNRREQITTEIETIEERLGEIA